MLQHLNSYLQFSWLINFFYLFLYISLHVFLIPNDLIQIQIFQIRNLKQRFVISWSSFNCNFWIKFKSLIGSTFVGIEGSFLKSLSWLIEDQDLFNYKGTYSWWRMCGLCGSSAPFYVSWYRFIVTFSYWVWDCKIWVTILYA